MSELDTEQNERIRLVESRINELENQVNRLIGELSQTMKILKIVGIGLGAMIGIDVQGMVM
jgi:tetrahydromethanopterin S-methyltransferase subunit G|tara:strand:- start:3789 stop:3971 length:183 start_codon:yes stop_codon:yes gene_type:complete